MKSASNNLAISLFITSFFILGKTSKVLLDGLGIGIGVKFMLCQFPRNSTHISMLSCKDVPIFLEEFDEHKFLFKIQIIPHMSDLRGLTRGEWNSLTEVVLQLFGQFRGLGLRHN
jgi:hypothetical protein